MRHMFWVVAMGAWLVIGAGWAASDGVPEATTPGGQEIVQKCERAMVLVLVGNGGGRLQTVSSGVIIRSDGMVLTAYRPLQGAPEVQVRLKDGEVYDQATLVGFDERRNVAALHIPANGLPALAGATMEGAAGEKSLVLYADAGMEWSSPEAVLGPTRLADDIPGAGHGYRLIQFMAPLPPTSLGGALLNSRGQLLGIIAGSSNAESPQFAVPVASVEGLPAQGLHQALGSGRNLALPSALPHHGIAPDAAPGTARLMKVQTLRVATKTVYFTPFMLEKELLSNMEFCALGISVLDGSRGGDVLVTVDRPVFTYDFTYSVTNPNTGIILSTGKVTAIDGPHAAQGIARRLAQELARAQSAQEGQPNQQEAFSGSL